VPTVVLLTAVVSARR